MSEDQIWTYGQASKDQSPMLLSSLQTAELAGWQAVPFSFPFHGQS
jgi:hypothetical protein